MKIVFTSVLTMIGKVMVTGSVRLEMKVLATIAPTTGVPTIRPTLSRYSSRGKRDEFGYTEKARPVDSVCLKTSLGSITVTLL